MGRKRKNYTPEQKVSILKKHLVDHIPVSDLCDQYSLHPNVFYRWQKEFFENGAAAFQTKRDRSQDHLAKKIDVLEDKLSKKNEVLSELMEEHIALKKSLGEL